PFPLVRRPLMSLLSPYTTLFRSCRASQCIDCALDVSVRHDDHVVLGAAQRLHPLSEVGASFVDILRDGGRTDETDRGNVRVLQQDRKSTRLNSSHVKTSYAVFCV